MINFLKAQALKLACNLYDAQAPFDDFTRAAEPKYPETLKAKAEKFEIDLLDNFVLPYRVNNYRIPLPEGSPLDLGDQCLHSGLIAMGYAFNGKLHSVNLSAHQPDGLLIRGVDEKTGCEEYDASNDQASGHLAGLYFTQSGDLLIEWVETIIDNGYALVNPDGKATRYGQLEQGALSDPLRITLLLAILAAASKLTGSLKYDWHYDRIFSKYHSLIPYAKSKLWLPGVVLNEQSATVRAAIHLTIIQDVFPCQEAMDGLNRVYAEAEKTGNLLAMGLCLRHKPTSTDDSRIFKTVLSEFTLDDKQYNTGKVNSTNPAIPKALWGGQWVSRQPMPVWMLSAQDNFWTRSLNNMDFRKQGDPPDSRYSGADYLEAYWLGRTLGVIGEND